MSRCIECRRPKEAHGPGGECPYPNKTRYGTMDLPAGKTCADCVHIRFCTGFLGDVKANTHCDWFPIRFVPKV